MVLFDIDISLSIKYIITHKCKFVNRKINICELKLLQIKGVVFVEINKRMFELLKDNNRKKVELADFLGVGTGQITTWEKRETDPPAKFIVDICKFFGISVEYFLTGNETYDSKKLNLTENEKEMLHILNRLTSEKDQAKLIGYAECYVDTILHTSSDEGADAQQRLDKTS